MARPRKIVDRKRLREMAAEGLTTSEMAASLGVSPDTLERRYHNDMIVGKETGKASLRGKQFAVAMTGNPTMLIWLGKNMLGQKDQVEVGGSLGVTMRREEVLEKLTRKNDKAK